MDKFIKSNPKLIDIQSKTARDNLTLLVEYLCSSVVPDKLPSSIRLSDQTMQECHSYVSKFLYTDENAILADDVLQKRTDIADYDCIDGFASTYDLTRENLIDVSSKKYFESVAVLEHEMIHILQALNNNNPEKQYNEVLSMFGEFVSLELLSEKYNNSNIYMNNLINRCIKRMSYRVYGRSFEDEAIDDCTDYMKKIYLSVYEHMLGFIYAIRLFDLYHQDTVSIIADFNLILAGKMRVKDILSKYRISLEDEDTLSSFIKLVDVYRESVVKKYGTRVHTVK